MKGDEATEKLRITHQMLRFTLSMWKRGLTRARSVSLTTLLFLCLLAIVQPLWNGYQFGVSDHSIQFPMMNRIMDKTLYPNDPMLDTARGYVSFFPRLMVILIEVVGNMEALYFVLHIVSYFLYFTMLYYICLLLFDKMSAILCLILISTSKIVLGGSSIHYTGLYPSSFMLPFVLLAIYLFLRERYAIAYAILGISFNFHVLISSYTFCMFFCDSLFGVMTGKSSKSARLKELAKYMGIFLLCAMPAFIWSLATRGEMTDEWIRLLRIRSSHHSFPLSWETSHYVNYLLFLSTGVLSLLYPPVTNLHRKILAFVLAIGVLCAAGLVFAEYYPVKLVLRGQFFRSTNFLTIFCVIYVSNYLRRSWTNNVLHKVAVIVIFLALFLPSYFNWLTLGLILALIAENIVPTPSTPPRTREGQRLNPRFWIFLLVLMTLLVRNFSPHDSFPNSLDLNGMTNLLKTFLEDRLLLLIICVAIMLMSVSAFLKNRVFQKLARLSIVALLFIYIIPSTYGRLHPENRYSEGWRDVQRWAKENTQKADLFLTPPYMTGFRIFSQRPIVGEWKDGTQQYFDAAYSYEWWRRMQDVKSNNWGNRDFDNLGKVRYIELAKKYGATYLVLPSSVSVDVPKPYDNGQYAVYRLKGE